MSWNCPNCGNLLTPIKVTAPMFDNMGARPHECGRCGDRWLVFQGEQPHISKNAVIIGYATNKISDEDFKL